MEPSESIVQEHAAHPHKGLSGQALKVHFFIHGMVEQQLKANDPPEVAKALSRMMEQGLSRHEAIHAIGTLVTKQALRMLKLNEALNLEEYVASLNDLSLDSANRKDY